MFGLFRWILKFIDLFEGGNELTQWGNGKWYVQYPDGKRSVTMYHHAACEYAEIFNGKVVSVYDYPETNIAVIKQPVTTE